MKKIVIICLAIMFLSSCTLYDRQVTSSTDPLVKREQITLFKNETQNNKKFFRLIEY